LSHEKEVSTAAAYLLLSLSGCTHQAAAPSPPQRYQLDVIFTKYSLLSRNLEIGRRTLTPLTFAVAQRVLSTNKEALREQPIDLTQERFTVYVPAGAPPKSGYGLLIFVPPWSTQGVPRLWFGPLNRHGLIFVNAANSGNEVKILDRRLPLALLAFENVRAQYPIDSKRVYIGGLSGGSRAALQTAVAYPDVFRGVLLNAGSDPIGGEAGIYLPPADLFRTFQEQMKLVYVTGDADEVNMRDDQVSRSSMKDWCVFNIEVKVVRRLGHEVLNPDSLDLALDMLERPSAVDVGKLARCNERIQRELASKLADAEAAIVSRDRNRALAKLKAIDGHYGGLAAPAILELEAKLAAQQ
jgi:pimeloyl-ACP methyl ester carboxylesterase